MSTLKVITYPNKVLKNISSEVKKFDNLLHKFLDNMFDTMILSNGIGLAAIQVANPIRVLLICLPSGEEDEQKKEDLLEIINPIVIKKSGSIFYQEGCLSVPGFYEEIERFESIELEYQDRYGTKHTLQTDDLLSIAIQHEIDHLDGKLFIEKLPYARRKKFEKEYKKAQKEKKKDN